MEKEDKQKEIQFLISYSDFFLSRHFRVQILKDRVSMKVIVERFILVDLENIVLYYRSLPWFPARFHVVGDGHILGPDVVLPLPSNIKSSYTLAPKNTSCT